MTKKKKTEKKGELEYIEDDKQTFTWKEIKEAFTVYNKELIRIVGMTKQFYPQLPEDHPAQAEYRKSYLHKLELGNSEVLKAMSSILFNKKLPGDDVISKK